jgi:hypothetical protein
MDARKKKFEELRAKIAKRTPEETAKLYEKALEEVRPTAPPKHPKGPSGKTSGIAFNTRRRKVFGRGKRRKTRRLPLH